MCVLCVCVCVYVCVWACVCVWRKNSSTQCSFPGSYRGWNNAGLTSSAWLKFALGLYILQKLWEENFPTCTLFSLLFIQGGHLHSICQLSSLVLYNRVVSQLSCSNVHTSLEVVSGGGRGREEDKFLTFKASHMWVFISFFYKWEVETGKEKEQR